MEFKALVFIICYIIIIYLLGRLACKLLKLQHASVFFATAAGFFVYYALFQALALPLILTGQSLSLLSNLWLVILLVVLALAAFWCRRHIWEDIKALGRGMKTLPAAAWLAIVAVAAQMIVVGYFTAGDGDDAYYIGNITTSLQTDTMFQIDPYTGNVLDQMEYRYALGSYMMNSAVLCKWFGLHPLVLARTALPIALVFISALIYYEIGKNLLGDRKKALVFVFFVGTVELCGLFSIYSTATFQLVRTAQGKGILAGEIMPMLFLLMLRLWKGGKRNADWILLGITTLAAVAISLSSLFLVPVAVGVFAVVCAIGKKSGGPVWKSVLALLPVVVIGVMYFGLSGKQLW